MSSQKQLADAVRDWAEVFLHHSMRDLGHFMHAAGLSMPQFNALMRLYHQESCGVSDIGRQLGVSNAAASQMIERMVQQGLLARAEKAGDRRVRQLSLTPKGRALARGALAARHQWISRIPAQLTREQQAVIVAGLGTLVDAARQLDDADAALAVESRTRTRAARFEKTETNKHS